jgi:hypothetical protein
MNENDDTHSIPCENTLNAKAVLIGSCIASVAFAVTPAHWTIFPQAIGGKSFVSGVLEGFGSARYWTALAAGLGSGFVASKVFGSAPQKSR